MVIKENKNPYEGYPEYFLGDTPEEAEQMFLKHSALLNGIAYTYSVSTGIEKGELFGEAIMGLATALKNFKEELGFSFKTYAVKVIKSVLNEYCRKNTYTVYVPAYIKRANGLLERLKRELAQTGLDRTEIEKAIQRKEVPKNLPTKNVDKIERIVKLIKREADRAQISYSTLIERAEYIPIDIELTDETLENKHKGEKDERDLEIALFVENLKQYMDETELSICNGIMKDKTYEQIAKEHNRTAPWVHQKLQKLRNKLKKELCSA